LTGRPPAAAKVSACGIQSGKYDYRRVEAHGIVHTAGIESTGRLALDMDVDGTRVVARIVRFPASNFPVWWAHGYR